MTKAVHLACPKAPIANAQVYTRLGFRTQFLSTLSLSLLARQRATPPSSLPPTLVLLVLQRARLPPPSSAPSLAKLPLKQQAISGWRPAAPAAADTGAPLLCSAGKCAQQVGAVSAVGARPGSAGPRRALAEGVGGSEPWTADAVVGTGQRRQQARPWHGRWVP